MELSELRERINDIDHQLVDLFTARMGVSAAVAEYKRAHDLPVLDAARERELLARIAGQAGEEMADYALVLYSTILALSRDYQAKRLCGESESAALMRRTAENTPKLFPECARVACQGVEGSYSQIAASKLFRVPSILYFHSFDGVFTAIESGMCEYGVLPIENSTAGSVRRVEDLLVQHKLTVVRSLRLKIDHCLLTKPGTERTQIREVLSHEQALDQCAAYLRGMGVKVTVCANTAAAAQTVAQSGRTDLAAVSSRECAALYGLTVADEAVQDQDNNYTRFLCVAKEPAIYPGANRTSVMLVTPNKPGALYHVLARIHALGLNLVRLESRPIPAREFEFMFYLDIEAPAESPALPRLISALENDCVDFRWLGTYAETIG